MAISVGAAAAHLQQASGARRGLEPVELPPLLRLDLAGQRARSDQARVATLRALPPLLDEVGAMLLVEKARRRLRPAA